MKCTCTKPDQEMNCHKDCDRMPPPIVTPPSLSTPPHILDEAQRLFPYEPLFRDAYVQGRTYSDPEYMKITGHATPELLTSYELGQSHQEATLMKYIAEWDGYANSAFGKAMHSAMERTRNEWVSVDSPPEITGRLICKKKNGLVCELWYDNGKYTFRDIDQTSQVSHWQYLPK